MPINIYTCKPEEIRDPTELADILMRMDIDKKECAPDSADIGILKIQSRQLGPIYAIESREKAEKEIKKPVYNNQRTTEWGIKFYPHAYFEALREKLQTKPENNNTT